MIGLKASGRGADTPDVVRGLAPVADRKAVASETLDIILKFVEPGIEGVRIKTIADAGSKPSGFVLILIPASESAPRRSKVDWRFYVPDRIRELSQWSFFRWRSGSARRPLPRLSIHIEVLQVAEHAAWIASPFRHLIFGLTNEGRGIAKFPGVRFKRIANLRQDDYGIDGNRGFGLPPRASEKEWIVYRGGVDDVIYPGETRLIGKLIQAAVHKEDGGIAPFGQVAMGYHSVEKLWVCEPMTLEYEVSAEGT